MNGLKSIMGSRKKTKCIPMKISIKADPKFSTTRSMRNDCTSKNSGRPKIRMKQTLSKLNTRRAYKLFRTDSRISAKASSTSSRRYTSKPKKKCLYMEKLFKNSTRKGGQCYEQQLGIGPLFFFSIKLSSICSLHL